MERQQYWMLYQSLNSTGKEPVQKTQHSQSLEGCCWLVAWIKIVSTRWFTCEVKWQWSLFHLTLIFAKTTTFKCTRGKITKLINEKSIQQNLEQNILFYLYTQVSVVSLNLPHRKHLYIWIPAYWSRINFVYYYHKTSQVLTKCQNVNRVDKMSKRQ